MLGIEAENILPRLEEIAQQELEQIALALAAVAQDKTAGVGFIVVTLVQIHEDVAAELIPADIKTVGVRLAGIIERIEIGDGAGRQDALELAAEGVVPAGANAEEALLLAKQEPVDVELAPHQLGEDVRLEELERVVIMSDELDVDRAVEERFAIAVHAVDQRHHILQIALGSDGLLEVVGVGFAHAVLIGRIVDDLFFLVGRDLTGVDAERHTVLFSEVAEDCLLLSGGGILSERPDASEGVATDDVVGTELDDGRSDHVKEVL